MRKLILKANAADSQRQEFEKLVNFGTNEL